MRFNRRDSIEASIVVALQRCGCEVDYAERKPYDLVCGRANQTYLLECKEKKGKLRKSQIAFKATWAGHYAVVRSVEEALFAVGIFK